MLHNLMPVLDKGFELPRILNIFVKISYAIFNFHNII